MALDSLWQMVSGLSESAVLLVAMATGLVKRYTATERFRIKRRAFCLVSHDGRLLVFAIGTSY